MSIKTRSKARKHEMTSDSADSSRKLDDILATMDVLITAKNEMLSKLNKLELAQSTIIKDVEDLKNSFQETDIEIRECNSKLSLKADRTEVEALKEKMDNLENRSKRNNVVIWGVPEGSEEDFASMEEFIEVELLQRHMKLERKIEVMRSHRSSFRRNPSENETPKPRPVHVYLLRYTDKVNLLKLAASKLKDNKYKESMIFISDDVSKSVRDDRSKLRKNYLQEIKARPEVQFAFIPWSVPARILYKKEGMDSLKSFYLPKA